MTRLNLWWRTVLFPFIIPRFFARWLRRWLELLSNCILQCCLAPKYQTIRKKSGSSAMLHSAMLLANKLSSLQCRCSPIGLVFQVHICFLDILSWNAGGFGYREQRGEEVLGSFCDISWWFWCRLYLWGEGVVIKGWAWVIQLVMLLLDLVFAKGWFLFLVCLGVFSRVGMVSEGWF